MRFFTTMFMVLVLAIAGVAVAAPEDGQSARDINGFALSLGISVGAAGYNAISSNDLNLGLVPSFENKIGLDYNFNEKHAASIYFTGEYATLSDNGFYTTQGSSSKNLENKADVEAFTNGGGFMFGGGVGVDYTFKPTPAYGFGPYVETKDYNVLTCSSIYKIESRNMTCDYAKASSVGAGLSASYYTHVGFNPYLSLGYSQINFDNRPYQGVTGSIGVNYVFKPHRDASTAAILIF